jgi:DNA replication licensing factor MCM5
MSGFDANHVYTVSVHDTPAATAPDSLSDTEKLLLDFLLQYRVGGEFVYRSVPCLSVCRVLKVNASFACRDKLRANLLLKHYQLEVDLRHVGLYHDELAHAVQDRPADTLPLVRTFTQVHSLVARAYDFASSRMRLPKPLAPSSSQSRPQLGSAPILPRS